MFIIVNLEGCKLLKIYSACDNDVYIEIVL